MKMLTGEHNMLVGERGGVRKEGGKTGWQSKGMTTKEEEGDPCIAPVGPQPQLQPSFRPSSQSRLPL